MHDPLVDPELARRHSELAGVQVVTDPYLVGKDAVALAVLTEWSDYPALDWHQIGEVTQRRVVVDTRNVLDRETLTRAGFTLYGNGITRRYPLGTTRVRSPHVASRLRMLLCVLRAPPALLRRSRARPVDCATPTQRRRGLRAWPQRSRGPWAPRTAPPGCGAMRCAPAGAATRSTAYCGCRADDDACGSRLTDGRWWMTMSCSHTIHQPAAARSIASSSSSPPSHIFGQNPPT